MMPNSWIRALPMNWWDDPVVVAVNVPPESHLRMGRSVDGEYTYSMVEMPDGEILGLHVLSPPVGDYLEHVLAFRAAGKRMVPPEYLGPLSGLPDAVIGRDGHNTLVLSHADAHLPFLNIVAYLSKKEPVWN